MKTIAIIDTLLAITDIIIAISDDTKPTPEQIAQVKALRTKLADAAESRLND